ncbi:hypothetical protein M2132_002294 [Dysgonomonas sp. PH5-45]|uniref:hypothetical protein n=1 Tax=unclassified Dysgonomonas TaxID=2630389 RepID=UPI0024747D6E|nr:MULTISPECIES: hypothetical protein [unclassified Dysgonomonas]MDH6355943.1 hypothetical protein [Dysgonomonas sp. PH5-45]MDH6388838.1 hypothetical protein [Dysgonomonas sp. PH5-37]
MKNKTYPIYEFISNPTKKAQIKAAVDRHIANAQLNMMCVMPLYLYYHTATKTHTTSHKWDLQPNSGYIEKGIAGYVLCDQEPGTTALWQYYFHKGTPYQNNNIVTTGVWTTNDIREKWHLGYVYPFQAPGTIPLYEFMQRDTKKPVDHCTTAYYEIIQNKLQYRADWSVGYVYPVD